MRLLGYTLRDTVCTVLISPAWLYVFIALVDGLSEGTCSTSAVHGMFTSATLQFLAISDMVTDPIPDALSLAAHQSMHVCASLVRLELGPEPPLAAEAS
jgi:hypothetical protein